MKIPKLEGPPIERKTLNLWRRMIKMVAPPPELTISEWADRYRKLSPEASAEPGQWRTDRAPYQREIMDAISDKNTERVILMTSAQIGKTELILNTIGYYIDYDPAPILQVQPTEAMAETFSKDRLAPMIRDCPTIRSKVSDAKSRDSNNTIMHKKFPGGHITLVGANTPSQLASRPIRVVLFDEVDRFPMSAGDEGDPVSLAIKRTTTFWNRKIVMVSTPTIKGVSRIEMEYEDSSQETWNLPCPDCGEYQPLEWEQLKFKNKSEDDVEILGFACKSCGALNDEHTWKKQKGKWIAKYPNRRKKRGFHLNELASPWKRWDEVVRDFLHAKKSPETLKVWVNTSMGRTWEEYGDLDMDELLAKRREMYNCEVPLPVVVLTAGVDVQDNRLEYEIVGWGKDKESWGIKYGVLMGDPGQRQVWDMLTMVLERPYIREDGLALNIMTTCIDTGGHYTSETYAYCKANEAKRVWGIKGQGGSGIPFIQRPKRRNDSGVWLFNIGVDVGKDTIVSRLKVNTPGKPGYCHFPMEPEKGYDEAYFEGLTSERRVVTYRKGRPVIRWEKKTSGARNEPFDLRNYATAALEILNPPLDMLYKQLNENNESPVKQTSSRQLASAPRKRRHGVVSKGISGV